MTGRRSLLAGLAVLVMGCATTGRGTGFSPEAESRLRGMGPPFNRQFDVDGSSIEAIPERELRVEGRNDAAAALSDDEQAVLAQQMAAWIWVHHGGDAGVGLIAIRFTNVSGDSTPSGAERRFTPDELAGHAP